MRYRFRAWDKEYKKYLPLTIQQVGVTFNFTDLYVIEQCTGLKDKNGKHIHEGDILQEVDDCEVGIVEWCQESAMFVVNFDGVIHNFDDVHPSLFYVIGNIHENPEISDQFEQSRLERLQLAGMEDRIRSVKGG